MALAFLRDDVTSTVPRPALRDDVTGSVPLRLKPRRPRSEPPTPGGDSEVHVGVDTVADFSYADD